MSGTAHSITPPAEAMPRRLPRPQARVPIGIRAAAAEDLTFIDSLQKAHRKMLGFMHRKALETYVAGGDVLIAEARQRSEGAGGDVSGGGGGAAVPLGYCIARDRYFKRDDCGIVYQLNIIPGRRRRLVGAALIAAAFERAAYGCRLFCCWCAQDLEANRFWEAMGFVPLAFRVGSRGRRRIHIFWQRRIRADDAGPGATPFWFPAETSGGAARENRIVLPIPPGMHWSDPMPAILPGTTGDASEDAGGRLLESDREKKKRGRRRGSESAAFNPLARRRRRQQRAGGLWFAATSNIAERGTEAVGSARAMAKTDANSGERRGPKSQARNDPKLVAAARELRDRCLERINADDAMRLPPRTLGKYDVSREIDVAGAEPRPAAIAAGIRLLDAA